MGWNIFVSGAPFGSLSKTDNDFYEPHVDGQSADRVYGVTFDPSSANSIYTNSGKVRPDSLVFNYIIKC